MIEGGGTFCLSFWVASLLLNRSGKYHRLFCAKCKAVKI